MLLKEVLFADGRTVKPEPMPVIICADSTEDGTYIVLTRELNGGKTVGYRNVVDWKVELNDYA